MNEIGGLVGNGGTDALETSFFSEKVVGAFDDIGGNDAAETDLLTENVLGVFIEVGAKPDIGVLISTLGVILASMNGAGGVVDIGGKDASEIDLISEKAGGASDEVVEKEVPTPVLMLSLPQNGVIGGKDASVALVLNRVGSSDKIAPNSFEFFSAPLTPI